MNSKNNYSMSIAAVLAVICLTIFSHTVKAQSVIACPTANVGNFGLDGDLSANSPASLAGINDDWFYNMTFPGPGQGIIGTSAATSPNGISAADFKAILQGASLIGRNRTYVQRMAVPNLTPRIVNPATGAGYLLLDAVAARDNHTAGGAVDSTAFAGGPDKNGANPNTWTIGVAGVQQKNDLIDVGGHIRREFNFATGQPGALWGYAFATTRNTSGDAHTDFEIFRTAPYLGGGGIQNTGPDGGHTKSLLQSPSDPMPGATKQPGDVLVSVDYQNGGVNPVASVRVWINPLNVDGMGHDTAWANAQAANKPFSFTGVFDSGTGAAPYGYAEIRPKSSNCLLWSVENTTTVAGTPWGNLTAQNAAYSDNMEPLVNVEVAIDFSAFGLDLNPVTGPCYQLFGSLLVKTRSSQSFTAEMKDASGPFVFGNFTEVNANAGADKNLECSVTQLTLDGSSLTPGAIFNWSVVPGTGGHIVSGANTCCPVVDAAGTYVLAVTNPQLASCFTSDTVVVVGVPDVTPPTATCPPPATYTCADQIPAGATTRAAFVAAGGTAYDESGTVNVSFVDGPLVGGSCGGTITRTYTLSDACNNTMTCTQVFTINDNIPPTISGPADQSFGCNPTIPAANIGLITASDNCTGVSVSVLPDQISGSCTKTLVRTYRATDGCGNTADWVQTFTYSTDTQAPTINASGSVANGSNIGCNPSPAQIDAALGTATATDACGAVTANPSDDAVVVNGCYRSQTRNWTSTDACGNTASAARTISWKVDLTAPVITAVGSVANNADLGCNPSAAQIDAALGTGTATDNCDNVSVTSSDDAVVSNGCYRSQVRTFSSTDDCGNSSSVTRTINWKVDLTAPVITAVGSVANNANLGCNPSAAQIDAALGTGTATDNCDNVSVTAADGSVSVNGCYRSQVRTFSSTDDCGNSSSVTRTINWKVDLTAPVITAVGSVANNANLGCNPSAAQIDAALGTGTATDNCDNVSVTATDGSVSVNGCYRSQVRTFSSTDDCGNSSSVTRTINWKVDLTAPVITTDGSVDDGSDLGCNPSAAEIDAALGTATVTDDCDNVSVTATDGAVVVNGCYRTQTRTWNSTDLCGNTAQSKSRTISWKVDLTAPVITATGSVANNSNLGCNPSAAQIDAALGTATASDDCDAVTAIPSDNNVVVNGCYRSQTRLWRAVDECGNLAIEVTRTITWKVDLTAPVIHANGSVANNANLGCNPSAAQIDAALGVGFATDDCDAVTVVPSDGSVSVNGCYRSQTRTFSSTDLCGNSSQVTRTINWKVDLTAPVITSGGSVANNTNLGCNPSAAQIDAALGTATATDDCDAVSVTATDGSVSVNGCYRSQIRTFSSTDLCGNSSQVTRTINWKVDLTAPVITAGGSVTNNTNLGCNPSAAQIDAALGTATATDDCDAVSVTTTDGSVSVNGCYRSQTRTFSSTDLCGNSSQVTRTINWKVDLTAPVITAGGSVANNTDLGCNPSAAQIDAALGTATATDDCDEVSVSSNDGAVSINGCYHSQTRTFSSTDLCGNSSQVTRTINWKVDLTAPVITAGGSVANNTNLGCNPSAAQIDAALGTATATDDCDEVTVTSNDGPVSANGCQNTQTRTFTSTDLCGNSSQVTRTISWKVDLTAPVVTCSTNSITVCNGSAVAFTSAANDDCDGALPVVYTRSDGQSMEASYPVGVTTVTASATDACGNTGTCMVTVTVLANPTCTLAAPAIAPICGSTGNTLSAASENATSYSWSVSGNGWAITAGASTSTITYTAGNGPATFTLTVTNSLNGVNCSNTCQVTFECSGQRFCTYTQGYYGAAGGANCSGLTTKELLKSMLFNNPLVIGSGTNKLTCVYNDAEYGRIFLRLPAGGTSVPLNGVATFANPVGIAIANNGTFANTLIGQTLTLGFNFRIPGSGLANLRMTGKYITTAQSSGTGCNNPSATAVPGTNQTMLIPAVVLNYLGANNKISDLYALANQALAGQLPSTAPSLGLINSAVDAINKAFDGCRMFVSFSNVAPTGTVREVDGEMVPAYDLSVSAYPNPFTKTANIDFSIGNNVENAVVEVYTMTGVKVSTLFNGNMEANKKYSVQLDGSDLAPGIYIYQINTGDHVYTNKLIMTKE